MHAQKNVVKSYCGKYSELPSHAVQILSDAH